MKYLNKGIRRVKYLNKGIRRVNKKQKKKKDERYLIFRFKITTKKVESLRNLLKPLFTQWNAELNNLEN